MVHQAQTVHLALVHLGLRVGLLPPDVEALDGAFSRRGYHDPLGVVDEEVADKLVKLEAIV